MARPIVDVEVATLRADGRYLFIVRGEGEDHAAGVLCFPGGAVDHDVRGDILEATAAREVEEETGLLVSDLVYAGSHTFTAETTDLVLVTLFIGRLAGGEEQIRDVSEVAEIRWLTADEFLSSGAVEPWMAEMVARVERKRQALGW